MIWHDLLKVLGQGRIVIQTHDYPDPDAIASAFGLQAFLRHFGIESLLCYNGDAERIAVTTAIEEFSIPIFAFSNALQMTESDTIVIVDGQKSNANVTDLPGDEVACIDHHPILRECNYRYVDIRQVGACSSIIADYFFSAKIPLSSDVATMLLYGLQTDTHFMTRGVVDLDLEIFPKLYRLADHVRLGRLESRTLEFADLKAFGVAINEIELFGRTGIIVLPFSCSDALIAQVADFILSLAEVDIAIIASNRSDGLKFSLRGVASALHCGHMLAQLLPPFGNGGGHACSAGGFVSRSALAALKVNEEECLRVLKERFLHYIAANQGSPTRA